jgi:cytochrome c553
MRGCIAAGAAFLFTICSSVRAETSVEDKALIDKGYYLSRAAGCADCHTTNLNAQYAGGYSIDVPNLGKFFSPNITPDPDFGIGNWSEDDFQRALRKGVDPTGRYLYPVFPYRSYAKMTSEDVHAIYMFLKTVPKSSRVPPEDEFVSSIYKWRKALMVWREFDFPGFSSSYIPDNNFIHHEKSENADPALTAIQLGSRPFEVDSARSPEWNRGAYLVEGFSHCTECHTPRYGAPLHGLIPSQWMSGTTGSLNRLIPNITPDVETGLGTWSKKDWIRFLESGYTREGTSVGVEMAEVVKNTSSLTDTDRAAMAEYLISLKPVKSRMSMVEDFRHPRLEDLLLTVKDSDLKAIPSETLNARVQECTQCHNSISTGGQIAGQNEAYLQIQLKYFLRNLRGNSTGVMNDMANRLDTPINNISWINIVAHYFANQPRIRSPKPLSEADKNLAGLSEGSGQGSGKDLATKMCVSCHMNSERRNAPINGLVPVLAGQSRDFLKRRLRYFQSPEGERSPLMSEMAKSLTESEIEKLAIYFESQ